MNLRVNSQRVSARRLAELRDEISGRDVAILRQVAELRFMTSRQIEVIHFKATAHSSELAAARASRRTLEHLSSERLLVRLDRRIGGIRAGSASFVYAIGPVGERLLELPGPRHRFREPSAAFLKHTLAISQVVTDLTTASQQAAMELLGLQTEPRCWRTTIGVGGGRSVLRPDLYVVALKDDFEYRWFIEVDLGSEHLPTLVKKCLAYEAYYRSGIEQAAHGVFPRVLWLMHRPERVQRLRAAVEADQRLTTELFVVTTTTQAVLAAAGGRP